MEENFKSQVLSRLSGTLIFLGHFIQINIIYQWHTTSIIQKLLSEIIYGKFLVAKFSPTIYVPIYIYIYI